MAYIFRGLSKAVNNTRKKTVVYYYWPVPYQYFEGGVLAREHTYHSTSVFKDLNFLKLKDNVCRL